MKIEPRPADLKRLEMLQATAGTKMIGRQAREAASKRQLDQASLSVEFFSFMIGSLDRGDRASRGTICSQYEPLARGLYGKDTVQRRCQARQGIRI